MKIKTAVLFTMVLLLFTFSIKAASNFTLYYQSGDSIYRITDLSSKPQIVTSNIHQTIAFSHSGRYGAYYDSEGVWLSRTEIWSPERVISMLPREEFALDWTPDDTRLILRMAFWPKDTDPAERPLAYNLLTKSAEPWIWGECDQIAQQVTSNDFALICKANQNTPPQPFSTIALRWGGEFREYDADQYQILRGGLLDFYPRPFDWGVTPRGQNMVYMTENPNYQRDNPLYSFWELVSLWSTKNDVTIDSPQQPGIERVFAVSPDRSLVAYTVFCGQPTGSCLQIADLGTREIKWSYLATVQVDSAYDIAWFPDNESVALLGANADANSNYHHVIYVFDIDTGHKVRFDVENTSGVIVVV